MARLGAPIVQFRNVSADALELPVIRLAVLVGGGALERAVDHPRDEICRKRPPGRRVVIPLPLEPGAL